MREDFTVEELLERFPDLTPRELRTAILAERQCSEIVEKVSQLSDRFRNDTTIPLTLKVQISQLDGLLIGIADGAIQRGTRAVSSHLVNIASEIENLPLDETEIGELAETLLEVATRCSEMGLSLEGNDLTRYHLDQAYDLGARTPKSSTWIDLVGKRGIHKSR